MRAIIVGCGRVGSLLTQLLEQDGHQVVMIDKDPAALDRLPPSFRGQRIAGVGFDRDVLRAAGIERADALAAVTSGDNSNFIIASVAHDTYRVPIVIARIYDPKREQIYRRLGIRTISSTTWGAHRIKRLIVRAKLQVQDEVGNGEVELVEARIAAHLAGRTIREISLTGELMPYAIVRAGRAFIPMAGTILEEGDIVHISVDRGAVEKLETMLR